MSSHILKSMTLLAVGAILGAAVFSGPLLLLPGADTESAGSKVIAAIAGALGGMTFVVAWLVSYETASPSEPKTCSRCGEHVPTEAACCPMCGAAMSPPSG